MSIDVQGGDLRCVALGETLLLWSRVLKIAMQFRGESVTINK